jgi:hypothetical protein
MEPNVKFIGVENLIPTPPPVEKSPLDIADGTLKGIENILSQVNGILDRGEKILPMFQKMASRKLSIADDPAPPARQEVVHMNPPTVPVNHEKIFRDELAKRLWNLDTKTLLTAYFQKIPGDWRKKTVDEVTVELTQLSGLMFKAMDITVKEELANILSRGD